MATAWDVLYIMYNVYDSIKEEMFAEVDTCSFADDERYLLLDVARRRAGKNPRDVENCLVPEVDLHAIEDLLDLYYSLRMVRYIIRTNMSRRSDALGNKTAQKGVIRSSG